LLMRLARVPGSMYIWKKFPIGSIPIRVRFGLWDRPEYAYGLFRAAELAAQLGVPGISAIEFGVAGGNGLLAMESIASEVSRHFDLSISVYGFDTGVGLPPPEDYRDLPHVWGGGFYQMDVPALKAQLKHAKLILGNVRDTVQTFVADTERFPVGFVAFDLDFYSSTRDALQVFTGDTATTLPRVYCYFDDICHPEFACHNEFVGELRAIREFNEQDEWRKVVPPHLLRNTQPRHEKWQDQIYVFHNFQHPLYGVNIAPGGNRWGSLPLRKRSG